MQLKFDMDIKEKVYIHSGSEFFDINEFEIVQNHDMSTKPVIGGLWASPEDAEEGWQSINSIRPQDRKSFKFKLKETARVLVLENKDDLMKLPQIVSKSEVFSFILDFVELSKSYDVIYYSYNEEMKVLMPNWDCECILVMNPSVVDKMY